MVEINTYHLPPTKLIPNSQYPLVQYRGFLSPNTKSIATQFYDLLKKNEWAAQWIFRYGPTQRSHYHSYSHECMVVLTGTARIRFGVADTVEDPNENTFGSGFEEGGIELDAQAGDVFVIPAGVAHKTYNAQPANTLELLTPGDGHGLPDEFRDQLDAIDLSGGFTMLGAYPREAARWDFAEGGEGAAAYAGVWAVPPPNLDPVMGRSERGLLGLWSKQPRVPSKL